MFSNNGNGGFKESSEGVAYFPEDSVLSFDVLMEWVYKGDIRPFQNLDRNDGQLNWAAQSLYFLAEKLCLPELMDAVVDTASVSDVGLKKYALHTLLYTVLLMYGAESTKFWTLESAHDALRNNEELNRCFLKAVRDHLQGGKLIVDPRYVSDCVYHCHAHWLNGLIALLICSFDNINVSLGTEMVELYVGPEKKHFHVHKNILCKKVPYPTKMFESGFKEEIEGMANFPEDSTEAFDLLIEWIYTSNIQPIQLTSKDRTIQEWCPLKFYILAQKLCLPDLMDLVMDAWRQAKKENGVLSRKR
ncbi:hypothetical protein G7Y89_g10249 [Cudoniella acicularis]|uniref:BTB domain-containing protein n=1 Tax=Cudoniella acicularis TaxID=354080 RepID=A0A8H4RFW4_9HELO|nr:hypothetical protein G7Y89_g10249 [Cudoniella acicularis]